MFLRRARQKGLEIGLRTPPSADLHHRSDEVPNHVMEEPIGDDLEEETAAEAVATPLLPSSLRDHAPIAPLLLSALREREEGVVADDSVGTPVHGRPVELRMNGPAEWREERRVRVRRGADEIAVPARHRVVSWVEGVGDPMDLLHPEVRGEDGSEGTLKLFGCPALRR